MPIKPENRGRYPKDWALRSRFVRFYRAKNRCEWCGAQNGKPHPITGSRVVLTAAHVYDHRPEVAGLWNLAALCQRCHNRHDAPRRRSHPGFFTISPQALSRCLRKQREKRSKKILRHYAISV